MFKQLIASVASLSLLATAPAVAAVEGFDASHQQLLDSLRSSGVYVELNVPQLCDSVKSDSSKHGVYFYSDKHDTALMGICQDFGGKGPEVQWTANDLDTLRHESVHYLQDCLDGSVDGTMDPIYDGPGGYSPIDYNIKDVISAIGYGPAMSIIKRYEEAGADAEVIRLELEAFFIAYSQDASIIAKSIDANCPAQ